jgi:serine/threonine protein kinase
MNGKNTISNIELKFKRAIGEARIGISLAEHPNCVKYINAWEEDHALYIQTELCYGSLKDYIDQKDVIPEDEIWNFILDVALVPFFPAKKNLYIPKGLKHIHDNKLIHLDIKPGNILFSKDRKTLKIGDFGLTSHRRTTLDDEGDTLYVAPEIFEGKVFFFKLKYFFFSHFKLKKKILNFFSRKIFSRA